MAYYVSGSVTVGIWAKKAGSWVHLADHTVLIYQEVVGAGSRTVTQIATEDFSLGTGITDFGLTIEGFEGTGAALVDFISASWSATTTSGERSATPGGQFSTVTVIPK